ncbi:hypothetical protein [Candidatus Rhabdochlamydia sp. T3358]|uniref:hypothetical protein n=1 Tax=Candidatus Rhabdochlamydia sp. T3358 TaxID=2099795 RepID=UPI0010B247E1|nr:hypothetical protein [Candidatus Rhabdochlamydia sp. T3358]VHO01029.1 hypothetical protein RHT_00283 [Candidatus Rhabdochlamydia sp. T3358]
MNSGFTCAESEIRKWWLRIFLFSILLEVISYIDALELGWIPKDVLYTGSGFGLFCLYKWMFYYFGYLKRGTKFLTFSILLFVLTIGTQIASFFLHDKFFFFQTLYSDLAKGHPLFLFISYLISFAFFYANIKLRKMNKIRKLSSNPQAT